MIYILSNEIFTFFFFLRYYSLSQNRIGIREKLYLNFRKSN